MFVVVLGIIAVARGQLHRFNTFNRRKGTVVLLLGAYLMVLGGVTSFTTDDEIPTAVAAGNTCEPTGSISEDYSETFYCTPADSNEPIWASAADFTTHQKAETQKLEETAELLIEQTLDVCQDTNEWLSAVAQYPGDRRNGRRIYSVYI